MAAIAVKVSRVKLIEALAASLEAERAKPDYNDRAERVKQDKEYRTAVDQWGKDVLGLILEANKEGAKVVDVYNSQVTVDVRNLVDLPTYPQQYSVDRSAFQDPNKVKTLDSSIKILSLSDEETVNTSTYQSVVQYL